MPIVAMTGSPAAGYVITDREGNTRSAASWPEAQAAERALFDAWEARHGAVCGQPYDDGPNGVIYCTLSAGHDHVTQPCADEEYERYCAENPDQPRNH